MSDQKLVPKGLYDQEVEMGHTQKLPIPYIPLEDEIGDKVKADPCTFKVNDRQCISLDGQESREFFYPRHWCAQLL